MMTTLKPRRRQTPLTPTQRALAERFIPLARSLSRPLRAAYPELRDDFDSVALAALVAAARRYDPDRGVRFATYARHHIIWALCELRRRARADSRRAAAYHHRVLRIREGRMVVEGEVLPIGHELEQAEQVETMLRRLPRGHAAACRELFIHGRSPREAAEHLRCSLARLSVLKRQSIDMLRDPWLGVVETPRASAV
jgi:RNA polymerase sigma factor (sigma-70 family)